MAYDPGVVAAIRQIGQKRYASDPKKLRRYLLGGYETGIVESGLQDLPGGDADSYGFRQQRKGIYGVDDLPTQINNLYDEFEQHDRGQTVGQLVADVQRPAAQYRGRYSKVLDEARKLAGGQGVSAGAAPVRSAGVSAPAPQAPAQNPIMSIAAMGQQQQDNPYAATMQRGWDLLSKIWDQKYGGQNAPPIPGSMPDAGSEGSAASGDYKARADKINRQHLPYLWGGGHGGKVKPGDGQALDCSGAVSAVLGINPRVSGSFESWGKDGEGGKSGITVYANDEHVLMKIDGHFFGTSSTNPGGGAGWIPQKAIDHNYLKNFTARHL